MAELLFKAAADDADAPQRFARALLSRTAIALKLSTMHALDNAAMSGPIGNLVESVTEGVHESGTLVLQLAGDNFFLNGEVIKLDFSSYEAGQTLKGLLLRVGAHELAYLDVPSAEAMRDFLGRYQTHARSAQPAAMLKEKLGVFRLRAISKAEQDALAPTLDAKRTLLRAYAHVALVIEGQLALMKQGRQPRMARVRRAIHGLSDAAEDLEPLLIALTRLDTFAGAVHFHLAAVTALTLLMCRRMRMGRGALAEACMAAALHDFALDELPPPAGDKVTPKELEAQKRVPLRTLLRLAEVALGSDGLERLAATYEVAAKVVPGATAFGHLIAVPCVYDRLTRPQAPRKAMLPDQALQLLFSQVGARFDERVVRLLAGVLGPYPAGTVVKLSSGELALVVNTAGDAELVAKPRVKVLPAGQPVDLAAPNEKRTIVGAVDPAEAHANVAQLLLG
ncbi:MAG: hypothetical protein JNK82_16545 [Myxococcaceae bacterium]|nr:hypothetical protein [Myxococcaceae bacterium]